MVPHIVFNEKEKTYFLAPDFYEITRSPYAPNHIGTSGMTQSPMHAIACYYIYANDTDNQKTKPREFLKQIYPKLKLFHKYLMTDEIQRNQVWSLFYIHGNLALMIPQYGIMHYHK